MKTRAEMSKRYIEDKAQENTWLVPSLQDQEGNGARGQATQNPGITTPSGPAGPRWGSN